MSDVVGIKKLDKTSLLVVVAAGLEIECVDGRVRGHRTRLLVGQNLILVRQLIAEGSFYGRVESGSCT